MPPVIDPEEYKRLALEFAKAMVTQVPIESLAKEPGAWDWFCKDVFDLTDAFVDGLQDRLARQGPAAEDGAHVEIRTGRVER